MMEEQYITEDTLKTFGVAIGDQDEESLLEHLNEILQERIGAEVASTLDETRLEQLINLQEANSTDEQIGTWLQQNVPELKEIVEDEIAILMGEIAENTDAINKTA
ncbi:MAG TPA: DUF5663 domain-containing protein [Candidatus Chromulinivoraceae bacterium]|nr:DUF5663 domain-containing protein [Candidatus Chromulinivoraceae bacterium]